MSFRYCIWFLLSLPTVANGQSQHHFFTLGIEQGLSNPTIWTIAQDKHGFIWIGTANGLNRYDGHSVKQYFNDPKDSSSLPGNTVYWIYTDQDDDMWVACGAKGMAKYNYTKDCFDRLPQYETLKKNKYGSPVWRVGGDQQGRIYLACGGACYRFSKQTNTIEDLTPLFNGEIDDHGVGMFVPQGKDVLWILTDNGLFHYDLIKNSIRHVPFDKDGLGYGQAGMRDAEFINGEEMLITVARPGFILFNTRTWKFRPPPPFLDPSVSKQFTESGGVVRDKKGRIWVSNSTYGLLQYFPSDNTVYSLKNEPSYPYPHPEQEGKGMNVFADRDGNIWYASSLRGAVWFAPDLNFVKVFERDYSNKNSLGGNVIYGFMPLSDKEVLVGTGNGLSKLNTQKDVFSNLFSPGNSSGDFPSVLIKQLANDKDVVYAATRTGLCVYNKKNNSFQKFGNEGAGDNFYNGSLNFAHLINSNELILINGIAARLDLTTKKCSFNNNSQNNDPLFLFSGINATVYDSLRKKLWLEVNEGELYEYDVTSKIAVRHSYTKDSSMQYISVLHIDTSGMLFIGTSKGLIEYNPINKTNKTILLPANYQTIINITTEGNEVVWLTTAKEIIRLNRRDERFNVFKLNIILPYANFIQNSLWKNSQNDLWIGTDKGFCIVDTKNFRTNTKTLPPHLVGFSVFDKPKAFNQPYYDLEKIELKYNENFFSFDFSSLDFHQAAKYSYRLEKFDKDWRVAAKNIATYTNVPPGTYILHLRTQDDAGRWIEGNPVTIYVQPPFWQTLWFIIFLGITTALLIALAYRVLQKRKRKRQVDSTINYFANSMVGENSITEICWDIARGCSSQLKLEDCVVYLFDEEKEVLVQRAVYGPKNPREQEIINPLEIKWGQGIVGAAAASGKPVLVKDVTKDSRYIVDDLQRNSELAVPIIHEGKVIGVIDSEHSRKNFFVEEHVKALSTIAGISANKIAEAKAEEAAKLSGMKLLEIQKLLAETQLMALRAQMNPHFVFNCLNSIQECIVTEKYGEASLYLNKFSKLFRSVLNNSGKVLISLADEIEVLELYLSLEEMRFEKSFQYKINVGEDLEADEILIPSMLLQPFVENALWHGLMHKPENRHLTICFKKQSEDIFQCVIDDNGIGRKKALELKEQQSRSRRHVSKGMDICRDRIDLLQKQGYHAILQIIDKYDEQGEALGTKVVIELSSYLK